MSSPTFLGDFIRAWAAVGCDARRLEITARLCGFEVRGAQTILKSGIKSADAPTEDDAPPAVEEPKPLPPKPAKPSRGRASNSGSRRLEPMALRPTAATEEALRWWTALKPLPVPPGALFVDQPPEPLLTPIWSRGILTEVAATFQPHGEIDVASAVRRIAEQRPLSVLPRRSVKSLSLGLCCVLDRNESMRPFFSDQVQLVSSLQAVLGRELTSIYSIEGTQISLRDSEGREPDQLPAHQPVLLVTDLGIGNGKTSGPRPSNDAWLQFLGQKNRDGHRVAALVPYPKHRWPASLSQAVPIIMWDRSTNAQSAAKAARQRRCAR